MCSVVFKFSPFFSDFAYRILTWLDFQLSLFLSWCILNIMLIFILISEKIIIRYVDTITNNSTQSNWMM